MALRPASRIVLRDMTRADIRPVRRIESTAYADAWPSRTFETELANAFARYRVAVERPSESSAPVPPSVPSPSTGEGEGGGDLPPTNSHAHSAKAPLRRRDARGPFGALRALVRRWRGQPAAGEERIVGFMGVWYMIDQLHLVTIAVAPDVQGCGVGQRLLLDCFDLAIAAELTTIVLEVRVSNARARALYDRFGFKRTGTLKGYYKDNNEDADVMVSAPLNESTALEQLATLRAEHRARFGAHFVDESERAD